MTTSVNPTLSLAENLFQGLVWDNGIKALTVAYPILGVWPVSILFKFSTDKLLSMILLTVDVAAIPLLNQEHERAFSSASVALKVIAHDKGIDSPEFKTARDNAAQALARFVSFNK